MPKTPEEEAQDLQDNAILHLHLAESCLREAIDSFQSFFPYRTKLHQNLPEALAIIQAELEAEGI